MLIEKNLPAGQLERHWDALAQALNEAGPDREVVFLAKVVLLLATMLDNPARLDEVLETALQDLMHPVLKEDA